MTGKHGVAFATFDGAKAQAFLYDRSSKRLTMLDGFPKKGQHKPDFDDSRGRIFESVGSHRSGAEPRSDPEKLLEKSFVEEVAEALEALRNRGAFRKLVVAAGPRALGYFREAAPDALQAVVTKEIAGNYAGMSANELVDIVEDSLWD